VTVRWCDISGWLVPCTDVNFGRSLLLFYFYSNMTVVYLAQSQRSIVYVLENLRRTFANLVAPPIDIATNHLMRCKIGLFLKQMLKTTSKLIHNCRCYPSSNCCKIDQKTRFWIGRSVVAPSDVAEKTVICVIWMHKYSPSEVQFRKRYSGKFTSCMTFDAHKHVRSEPFLDYHHEVWHLLLAL